MLQSLVEFETLLSWASYYWVGLIELFLFDKDSLAFVVIFGSHDHKENVHKFNVWFCNGIGITTMDQTPHFDFLKNCHGFILGGLYF